MSIESILERILSDAQSEADEIIKKAEEEAKRIIEKEKSEAEEYFKKRLSEIDHHYKREKERAILNKRLEVRKNILGAKRGWMNKAFEEAFDRLKNESIEEYSTHIKGLIKSIPDVKDGELIFGRKGDDNFLKKLVDEINKREKTSFKLIKDREDFEWGFILRRGKIETNLSLESLFTYSRADIEQKAWEILNAGV